jgi:capsular exopolysaccharide synthesis family protein
MQGPIGGGLPVRIYRIRTLVRRYWWVLLLTVTVGLGIESWRAFNQPDIYGSTSDLIVRDEIQTDSTRRYSDSGSFIGNTLKMLQSPEVVEGAKRRMEIERSGMSGEASVTATVAPRTSIFTVTGTGTNPQFTQLYVNAVVDEFLAQYKGLRLGSADDVKREISDQLEKVRINLKAENAKLGEFVKINNMQFWNQQRDEAVTFLNNLRNRLNALTAERRRLENLTPDQLLSSSSGGQPAPAGGNAAPAVQDRTDDTVVFGELVSDYIRNIQALYQKQAQISERSRFWKPKHPRLQMLQSEADFINRTLDGLRSQALAASKARIAAIDAEMKSLELNIADWTAKSKEASEKDGEFKILEEAVNRLRTQEDKLMNSIVEIDTTADQSYLKVIRRAGPAALVPKGTTRHLLMGLLGGLVVGGIILFLLDRSDDRLASPSELLEHFPEPILGQIPDVAVSRTSHGLPLLQEEDERYTYAEAYRSLRSSLIFMPNQSDLRAILVTSAIPNEGKSTIASNLAVTMANAGARVLLVDADLRRGDIASLFDIDGNHGLSTILRGEMPWRDCLQDTKLSTLFIIPRGPVTNQSGELLLRPNLEAILDEMKASYDLVIFNTAPILATDDTPTLAPHFDGVLMVIRAQFTSAKLTQNALNSLYQRQVNVLGLILNCVDTETPDYYYYRYPKYYAA